MASIYITEFAALPDDSGGEKIPIAFEPPVATQKVTFTTATASQTFHNATSYVRILADANCHVAFGLSPTATANDERMIANNEYWRGVIPGHSVSTYDGTS